MKSTISNTWTTPQLTYRGTVGQILQGGGGKLSIAGSDPGHGASQPVQTLAARNPIVKWEPPAGE